MRVRNFYSRVFLPLLCVGWLSACGASDNQLTVIEKSSSQTSNNVESKGCDLACLGEYEHVFDLSEMKPSLVIPAFMNVDVADKGVRVIGRVGAVSGYKTDGTALELGDKYEREFHGKEITVAIIARAIGEEPASLSVAYSTNDQGNSGWKKFDLSPDYQVYSFNYNVPKRAAGLKDYLGFGAASSSSVAEVEILAVGIKQN